MRSESDPALSTIIVSETLEIIQHELKFVLDWLPNHLLIFHVLALFSIMNPLVIPFAWIYFMVDSSKLAARLLARR